MYSNKRIMNDAPMKKLIPFFNSDNTRRYSYTDGMTIKNEGKKPIQNNVPLPQHIEKLQKKLLEVLETNYEVNKKYGNILANNEPLSPKPYPTEAEQKRSAAIHLLRKRTNNIVNGDNVNSLRKGSADEYLLANNKVSQRQQALSVLMRRVSNNNNTKKNDNLNLMINTDFRKYSYDSLQNQPVNNNNNNNNNFNNKRLDLSSPNLYSRNYDNSPYFNTFHNYDMVSNPNMTNIPTLKTSMEINNSPSLNALRAYDMNNSNNVSNILSPISSPTTFMNGIAATARKSINLGSIAAKNSNSRIFENNRLITNDLAYYDINSCPNSPMGAFNTNGSFFNNRIPSSEELNQRIAESQIMNDYFSKLCMNTSTGDLNEKETSLFSNNMINATNLPPAYLNNDINMNDYAMQSPLFTSSSSNHSSPKQNDGILPLQNQPFRKYSLNDSPNTIGTMNNLPTPYVNTNKVITLNVPTPSSPYLGNSKANMASPFISENGSNNANVNLPKFNTTPSSSPYIGIGGMAGINLEKSQMAYKKNQSNNLIGRGMPSPSPSFSNSSNGNGNSGFMINNASPGLYPIMNINDISPSNIINDNASYDLQQSKYSSKSMPNSPSFGFSEPNFYPGQNGKAISSVMEQQRPIFYNNQLNSMMSSLCNNNSVQKSQSILPAYTSISNASTTQIPSPNIGAIGRPNVTKLLLDDESKNTNPLSLFAFEKQKNSPTVSGNSINDDFSKLSLGQSQNFHDASALLSSGITSINNSNSNNNENDVDRDKKMDPNVFPPNTNGKASLIPTSKTTNNSIFLNNNISDENLYKLFDDKNVYDFINNTTDLTALNNFESSNAVEHQSLEESPLINFLEDKNFNSYNIDMQMTSDAFSSNSNNNNMFSLSMQHPVLS
ncbi:hypothetical protein BCR36DRAFT_584369 [Piromyces finnis]|uniref:Uncharacterized protein n=1 Tax=Piromyces finnis TaxID=1754191 RepID=A0A1Y1V6R0_9FUNG|nr:hypothetical protein BCR36DRAFT_584369 [Piromyces finnis]|eukprot:ORX48452.1 hypothetical protein BCR36DRAFT_584369 [Piromyces finnis]